MSMSRVTADYKPLPIVALVQELYAKLVKSQTNPTQEELDQIRDEMREQALRCWNERSGK